MLSSVHLVGDDEDDIYGGFNDYNPAFDVEVRYKSMNVTFYSIVILKVVI
jgi:hypothetical protein